jgi:hypothetical protein
MIMAADGSRIAEKTDRYYGMVRDAREENDKNPNAHTFPSDESNISSSGTLGR